MSELVKGRIELDTTTDEFHILDQLREDYCVLIDLLQHRAYQQFLRAGKIKLDEQKVYDILNGLEYKFPQTLKNQVAKFYLERMEFMRTYRLPIRPRPYHMVFSGSNCFLKEQNRELRLPGIGSFKVRNPELIPELGEIIEVGFNRFPKRWEVVIVSKPLEEKDHESPILAKDLSLEDWLKVDRRADEKIYDPEFQPEKSKDRYSIVLKLITDERTEDRLEEMSLIQHRIFNVVWEEFLKEYKSYDPNVSIDSQVGKAFTRLKALGKLNLYGYPSDLGRSVRKELSTRYNQHRLGIRDMSEFKPHKVEDMHYFYSTSGRDILRPTYGDVVICNNLFVKFEGDISLFNKGSYATYLFFKKDREWYLRITQTTEESRNLYRIRYSKMKAEKLGLVKTS